MSNLTSNLDEIEQDIETSSQFFKPKPGKSYVLKVDTESKIIGRDDERFKDSQGKPLKRYQCKVIHPNNGRAQLWDMSKTVCTRMIELLRENFSVIKVTRTGSDRTTTYQIDGVE